jgi:hypothetical protein
METSQKNQNQPETKTILEVRSTCSGKKKKKKTRRSNYIYEMKLNNTKIKPMLAHWHTPCKKQNMINIKKCRFPNVFFFKIKIFYSRI